MHVYAARHNTRLHLFNLWLRILVMELQFCGKILAGKISEGPFKALVLLRDQILSEQLDPEVLSCWVNLLIC